MRRLRRNAGQAGRPRSVTAHARNQISAAGLLAWLDGRGPAAGQPPPDDAAANPAGSCAVSFPDLACCLLPAQE
jgi:hypothetical protein